MPEFIRYAALIFSALLAGRAFSSEPAEQIDDELLDRLMVTAHAYRAVRYFHGREHIQEVPWDSFLAHAVRGALTSSNIHDLVEEYFRPIAPTLEFDGDCSLAEPGETIAVRSFSAIPGLWNADDQEEATEVVHVSAGDTAFGESLSGLTLDRGGVQICIPVGVPVSGNTSQPKNHEEFIEQLNAIDATELDYPERALVTIIDAWALLERFSIAPQADLLKNDTHLESWLSQAAAAQEAESHLILLHQIMTDIGDSSQYISDPEVEYRSRTDPYSVIVRFAYADGAIYVVQSRSSKFKTGDRVLGIEDLPIEDLLAQQLKIGQFAWKANIEILLPYNGWLLLSRYSDRFRNLEIEVQRGNRTFSRSVRPLAFRRGVKRFREIGTSSAYVDATSLTTKQFLDLGLEFAEKKNTAVIDLRGDLCRNCFASVFSLLTPDSVRRVSWGVPGLVGRKRGYASENWDMRGAAKAALFEKVAVIVNQHTRGNAADLAAALQLEPNVSVIGALYDVIGTPEYVRLASGLTLGFLAYPLIIDGEVQTRYKVDVDAPIRGESLTEQKDDQLTAAVQFLEESSSGPNQ